MLFTSDRAAAEFNDFKQLSRRYGPDNAKRIRRRLDDLRAAANFADLHSLFGGRFHPLHEDRAGQFALDVRHPQRLIVEPADEPLPIKPDGGLDWSLVTTVRILEVEDYHGK